MVNLDNISFIEDSFGKKAVIISIEDYRNMTEKLEELEDIEAYIKTKNVREESFPMDLVENLLLGAESRIKLIREYRGKSVTSLAKLLDISESYLSQIENGKRRGNIDLYKKISEILETK